MLVVSEQYNLKYENYYNHLDSVWRDLFFEGTYSDLTLVCEGEDQVQFKVHKFVLHSCSRLFKTLLDDLSPYDSDPLIYLSGVHPRVMESILQLIYLGEATAGADKERIKELLKVADYLEINTSGLVVQDDRKKSPNTIMDFVASNYESSSQGEKLDTIIPTNGTTKENPVTQFIECKLEITEDSKDISEDFKPDASHDEAVFNEESLGAKLNVENRVAKVEDDNGDDVDDVATEEEIVKKEKKPRKERIKRRKDGNTVGSEVVKVKKGRKIKTSSDSKCPECEAVFTAKCGMVKHYRSIHLGVKYPCNQCDSQFTEKGRLQAHIRSKHEGIKYHLCDRCDYQTSLKSSLKRHIQSVHERPTSNEPVEMFLCDRCDFKSKRKDSLQQHIDDIHEGIRYHCDQCSQQFKFQNSLIKHMKTIHEGTRYPCPHCSYQATQRCDLKIHIESIHEGIRYPCEFCSYKATQKYHLKTHCKKMHSSEKRKSK